MCVRVTVQDCFRIPIEDWRQLATGLIQVLWLACRALRIRRVCHQNVAKFKAASIVFGKFALQCAYTRLDKQI